MAQRGSRFPTVPSSTCSLSGLTFAHANTEITKLETLLPTLDYGADGAVVKVNPLKLHVELGAVGNREPRSAIAREFAPDARITQPNEIRTHVGRTGARDPYAVPAPV